MFHSLEQRYVKLRDEHVKVKGERDELLSKESQLEDALAEEQRQLRAVIDHPPLRAPRSTCPCSHTLDQRNDKKKALTPPE